MNAGLGARILVLNALMGRIKGAFPIEQYESQKCGMSYDNGFVVITTCEAELPMEYACWIGTIPDLAEKLLYGKYLPSSLTFPLQELGYQVNKATTACTMKDAQVSWILQNEIDRIVFEKKKALENFIPFGSFVLENDER